MKKSITQSALKAAKLSAILVFGSVAASQLTGCVTVGQEFAAHRVAEIKIGQTKRQDISELFGSPWRTGMEDWIYFLNLLALNLPALRR